MEGLDKLSQGLDSRTGQRLFQDRAIRQNDETATCFSTFKSSLNCQMMSASFLVSHPHSLGVNVGIKCVFFLLIICVIRRGPDST